MGVSNRYFHQSRREAREGRELLFPLRLDDTILHTQQRWATRLRDARHIGDFTRWQDDAIYQQRLADLLRHLKVKSHPQNNSPAPRTRDSRPPISRAQDWEF